jgi:hypothetical protein
VDEEDPMNAERLLGALVREAMGGSSRGLHRSGRGRSRHRGGSLLPTGGMKGMLGMGALGVAIAAFDHYMKQKGGAGGQSFAAAPPPSPAAPGGASFGVPGATGSPAGVVPPPPPPPPGAGPRVPPPPPPASSAAVSSATGSTAGAPGADVEAILLVRAMIAAANADHELDPDERQRILHAVEESGVGESEKRFLHDEMERPMDVVALAALATTPVLKREVYLASEMAIVADSKAEQNYLARLARQLGLDDAQVAELRRMIGGDAPGGS